MSESIADRLLDVGAEDPLVMDGYDDCITGILERYGMEPVVLYDKDKVIDKIMSLSPGSSREEAVEYYEYNQLGGWHGDRTPGFVVKLA